MKIDSVSATSGAASLDSPFASIATAVEQFRRGEFVLILDDEDRENEGDLAIAAQGVTAETINFMAAYCRGLICVPIAGARLDELHIPLMVPNAAVPDGPAFTVSVDARWGVTSGISAADRARTVRTLVDPTARREDLVRPGHIFPLRYAEGGVLHRMGHTEASVDLAKLAGLYPAAVICEVMNPDGTMARLPQLLEFADRFGILAITIADLVEYRLSLATQQQTGFAPPHLAPTGA
jgi:3,4-dihydroxy-2-butanone 4-phosphate synthase